MKKEFVNPSIKVLNFNEENIVTESNYSKVDAALNDAATTGATNGTLTSMSVIDFTL